MSFDVLFSKKRYTSIKEVVGEQNQKSLNFSINEK